MEQQEGIGGHKFPKWAWIALGIVVVIGVIMFIRNATQPTTTKAPVTTPAADTSATDAITSQLTKDEKTLQDFEASVQTQLTAVGATQTQTTKDLQTIQGSLAQAEKDAASATAAASAAQTGAIMNGRISGAITSVMANGNGPSAWTRYINGLSATDPNADILGMVSRNLGLQTKFT